MKIVMVTGASSGMGYEFVKQLDKKCNDVDEIWVVARTVEEVDFSMVKTKVVLIPADLTKKADYSSIKLKLELEKPQVKILVNCSGFGKIGPFMDIDLESQEDMVELNDKALMKLCYMTIPYMVKGGYIINLASSAAFLPQSRFAVYAASKSFVLSFSRALHYELRPQGISVTAVCPGPVKTKFFEVAEQTGSVLAIKKYFMAKPEKVVAYAIQCAQARKNISVYGISMKGFFLLSKVLPHTMIMDFYAKFIK